MFILRSRPSGAARPYSRCIVRASRQGVAPYDLMIGLDRQPVGANRAPGYLMDVSRRRQQAPNSFRPRQWRSAAQWRAATDQAIV